ncbi:MAG: phosphodiester glycosidase family protein [Candidatus Woykebacteria bacterium]
MMHFFQKSFSPFSLLLIFLLTMEIVVLFNVDRRNIAGLNEVIKTLNDQVVSLQKDAENLNKENIALKSDNLRVILDSYNQVVGKYEAVKDKTKIYKNQDVAVQSVAGKLPNVVDLILAKKYTEADKTLTVLDNDLEKLLAAKKKADSLAAKKITSKATAASKPCGIPTNGYCRLSLKTANGTYTIDVVAINLNSKTPITDTANSSDCLNKCPTKSLLSYITSNSASSGMNGTYFCPPDYASCAAQVNAYDFPVYNSRLKKWINESKLYWSNRAMMAFTSSGAVFYQRSSTYSGLSGLRAAIVNFPGLVYNGVNIVNNYTLTSAQLTKSYRGGIGAKGKTVYLVVARSATVKDFAAVFVAMGVTHALNLDGGGSSSLIYNGSYKLGPGRSLPNAIVFR